MHPIGITQCCMWNSTLDEFLPTAAKAGYEAVELMLRRNGDLTRATGEAELRAASRRAEDLGLQVFSLVLKTLDASPVDGGEARKAAVADLRSGMLAAKRLGAGSVLVTLGRMRADLFYDEAYANGVASLREAGRTADELGVDIAIEFVWNGYLFSPMEMKRFLDDVGHPRVGFYFDPGNMAVFQFPQHWVRVLGRHTKLVHLKDWKGGALNGQWTALLEGEVNFPEVMKELHAVGYHGPLTSEVEPNLAPLDKTADAIRKIARMG